MIYPVETQQGPAAPVVPVEATNLTHALRSEWTKIRTVRSTMWTLGIMLGLVLGINMLMLWAISASGLGSYSDPVLSPGLYGLMLGQLAVITLGVLVITSEYGTGMIRTTFTACPQRTRVLTAKAIVFFGLSFAITTLACTVTALINWAVLSGKSAPSVDYYTGGGMATISDGATTAAPTEWLGATVGVGLYVALLGLLALAVGTLLRHSAGAITTMLGVVLLPLIVAIFMQAPGLEKVQEKLLQYSTPVALAALYRVQMVGNGHVNGLSQLVMLAVVTALALAGAYAVLARRDV
ncbi:ABC transporter permease [Streptomyces sp. NPDC059373]